MKKDDAIYYVALMGGIIVGAVAMRYFGFGRIPQLLVGLVVGVGFGFLATRALEQRNAAMPPPPGGPPGFQPDAGPCPVCGNARVGLYCSRCGTETGPAAPPPPPNQPWS